MKAVDWYKKAFELGHGEAADEIGTMYLVGTEIMPNPAEAFSWYRKGAEAGEAVSKYHLGVCYHEGLGTEADENQAISYLYQAYMAGIPGAVEYLNNNMNITIQ